MDDGDLDIMIDQYGIGPALQAAMQMYFHHSRHTGRTTRMLDAVQEGDTVVCANESAMKAARNLFYARGVRDVKFVAVEKATLRGTMDVLRGNYSGRFHFDHTFVERFYAAALERAHGDFAQLTEMLIPSGKKR